MNFNNFYSFDQVSLQTAPFYKNYLKMVFRIRFIYFTKKNHEELLMIYHGMVLFPLIQIISLDFTSINAHTSKNKECFNEISILIFFLIKSFYVNSSFYSITNIFFYISIHFFFI